MGSTGDRAASLMLEGREAGAVGTGGFERIVRPAALVQFDHQRSF